MYAMPEQSRRFETEYLGNDRERDLMYSTQMREDSLKHSLLVPTNENFEMVENDNLTSRSKANKPPTTTADKRAK